MCIFVDVASYDEWTADVYNVFRSLISKPDPLITPTVETFFRGLFKLFFNKSLSFVWVNLILGSRDQSQGERNIGPSNRRRRRNGQSGRKTKIKSASQRSIPDPIIIPTVTKSKFLLAQRKMNRNELEPKNPYSLHYHILKGVCKPNLFLKFLK